MPLSLKIGNHLFQPGLWPSLAFVALLTLLLSLAAWQWQRAGEKQALIDGREAHRQAAPLDLGRELPDPELDRFRPAVATGRYLTDQQWLLDNRLYRGQPGYHVFSLFRTREGRLLLVNRGWISVGESREFLPELPLPEGRVRISGHLDRPESVGLVLGEPPYDSIARQAAPLDLGRELPYPELDRFRPAVATGRYLTDQQWLLDNRLYRGQPGYHVFSLFRTREGRLLLVNRGWISVGESREFLPELPLPEGRVRISGHLDRPESVGLVLGEPPYDSIARRVRLQSLDVQALSRARGLDLPALTLVLDPQAPGALQYDWRPGAGIGPEKHLGYAVQWLALATALVIIYVGVNTRRIEHDEPREET